MSEDRITFTKTILERVSFDSVLFCKELLKAVKILLPNEMKELSAWFFKFTEQKPELRKCQIYLNL